MTSRLDQYYASELQYLADAGREFAKLHPQEAALLNPDNVQARDPHVERLFQNFAFLTGRIRAKLDDELPELSQSLLALLSPHYSRPIPSLATVQLMPDFTQLTASDRVEAGRSVKSRPLDVSKSAPPLTCSFRTCYAVDLQPLELVSASLSAPVEGRQAIELVFALRGSANWRDLAIDRIRLLLRGKSHQLAYSLYHHLNEHVSRVDLIGAPDGPVVAGSIEPVGFGRDEAVVPCPMSSFPGTRLVLEYLCFPEKFLYVDLCGLGALSSVSKSGELRVRIGFEGEAPAWWTGSISKDTFLQFCTPAINLFSEHAFPVDFDQRTSEYEVQIDQNLPDAFQVYAITSVLGRPSGDPGAEPRAYPAFLRFEHGGQEDEPYYHVTTRASPAGGVQTYLSLVTPEGAPADLPEQVLTVDGECFNGDYPTRLGPGDIPFRGDDMPHVVAKVRNLGRPTSVRPPVLGGAMAWHFISHLALNHLSLSDVETLSGILRLHDRTGDPANKRRLSGLTSVAISDERALIIRNGMAMQGMDISVELDESCFTELGDAYLFGQVLRHFMALYASINSFTRLRVRCVKSNQEWQWDALDGGQMSL